jgi:hypothetical protein
MINDESVIFELEVKIQLEELTNQLEELEPLLEQKKYSEVSLQLTKIVWKPISDNPTDKKIEKEFYNLFLEKKKGLNNQLPKKYRIEIEDKGWIMELFSNKLGGDLMEIIHDDEQTEYFVLEWYLSNETNNITT